MKCLRLIVCFVFAAGLTTAASGQLYHRQTEFLNLVYYDKAHEPLTFHLTRSFENSLNFHRRLFHYTPSEPVVILMQDFGDYGHGGTSTVPWNYISIGIEPFDYVYETMPANERMNWLMHHELVHVVATDKAADRDLTFRHLFHGKVAPEQEDPLSMFYSYLTSPRWYAPRWYHEGIAVFLETWMAGGLGRALGGYDEMTFRTMALENSYFYDLVGLESEGKTIDFQVGQNSYLYGTRFVIYLADRYGPEKLLQWFDRSSGSEPYFSRQFRKVYGTSLDEEWGRWIESEKRWQAANLAKIRAYPTSTADERPITAASLGSVSRTYYDARSDRLFAAVNHPGKPAQLIALDRKSGRATKLTDVIGPALYFVSSLAYDPAGEKLFYTTDNSRGWRDLDEFDLKTNARRTLLKDARTGDLVVNPTDRSIWGVRHNNGISSLVRIAAPYEAMKPVLSLEYGRDMFDLDLSPDGKMLTCVLVDVTGRQLLAAMETSKLLAGDSSYEVLHEFVNNAPENFVFSPDGRYLYGTSYYTGVSNIFRYDFTTKKMEAVSNAETGYFRPIPLSGDRLMAYRYTAKGFVPVELPVRTTENLNAVEYLGQKTFEDHGELRDWKAGSPGDIDLDKVTTATGPYSPMKSFRFASMFPVVEGYKDSAVIGMRMNFADPMNLRTLKVTGAVSASSSIPASERFHASAVYAASPWEVDLRYNASDFYDLFGPTKTSRKGYSAEGTYEKYLIFERPRTLSYTITGAYFGGLDRLPDYQNVATTVSSFSTVSGRLQYKNLKRTIGAVDVEKGVDWSLRGRVNYAGSEFLPRLFGTFSYGIPLPVDHSSLWFRASAGKSFRGREDNPFASFYFGGFGNNFVDYRDAQRYHEYYSFPGVEINDIGGTDFGKAMLEWTLPAVRFRRFGVAGLYSNWARASLFTSGLVTNHDSDSRRELTNAGVQVDFSVVMFSNLESMFSVGYARALEHGQGSDEVMVSLRLLK